MESNAAARRRVLEFQDERLHCEHAGEELAEAGAIDRSARIVDKWETLEEPAARRSLLEGVGREMMNVHEAPPGPLTSEEMPRNELGGYRDDVFTTKLNEFQLKQDDPKDALETYLHEYRHAEQHYEVLKSHGSGRHAVDPERSAMMEYNLDQRHYIRPESDYDAYSKQIAEVDAERFGTVTARDILERRDEIRSELSGEAAPQSATDMIAARRITADASDH